eukprot:2506775-Prymnesium_polylepis.1
MRMRRASLAESAAAERLRAAEEAQKAAAKRAATSLEWDCDVPEAPVERVSTPMIAMGFRRAAEARAGVEADGSLLSNVSARGYSERRLSALGSSELI